MVCQVGGACFYFFWLISNFISELMLFRVFLVLRNYRIRSTSRPYLWMTLVIVGLSAVLSFVPMSTYYKCKVGGYDMFCGWCFQSDHAGINDTAAYKFGSLIYAVPVALGIVLMLMFIYQVRQVLKRGRNRLTV